MAGTPQEFEGWVVVCFSRNDIDGVTPFVKTYGPFETQADAAHTEVEILRLEGGTTFVRPMVSWADTVRRISAD